MDTFFVVAALLGSVMSAFWLQKAALEGLFRIMGADRRAGSGPRP